jgi:hypothetical protein
MIKKIDAKKDKPNLKKLIATLSLIGYVFCAALLIFESCLNGDVSSGQSDYVGGGIANTVNSITGDSSQLIDLDSISIDNKISEAEPGDRLDLSVKFSPEDTSYKSLKYSTVDYDNDRAKVLNTNEVASVDNDGVFTFLKPGFTRIEVASSSFPSKKDGFLVEVKEVAPKSLASSIEGADLYDGIYRLYYGRKYSVTLSYNPSNSTKIKTTASYVSDSSFSYDDKKKILSANKVSSDIKTITFKNDYDQSIFDVISFEIKYENYNPVTSIELKGSLSSKSTIAVGETITYSIQTSPNDASDKTYSLEFDETYLSGSTTFIKGKEKSEGITTIKIYSNDNPDIYLTKDIRVDPAPSPSSFSLNISTEMIVGTNQNISLKDIVPSYAETSSVSYLSSDSDIVEILNNESLSAKSEGSATISATIGDIEVRTQVEVKSKEDPGSLDDYYVRVNENFGPILTDTRYNIPKLFSFYTDQNATDSLSDDYILKAKYESQKSDVTIDGTYRTFLTPKQYHIAISIEGIEKQVSIPVYPSYSLTHDPSTVESILNETNRSESLRYYVGDSFKFTVNPNDEGPSFTYQFNVLDEQNIISYSFDEKNITMLANKSGSITLTIDQYYDGNAVIGNSKTYTISIYDIAAEGFTITYYKRYKDVADEEKIVPEGDINYKLYGYIDRVQKLKLTPTNGTSLTPTGCSFEITSSDESIVSIDESLNIYTHEIGSARIKITMKTGESDFFTREFIFMVQNIIEVNETNPFTVGGKNVAYDEKSDVYSMMNGFEGLFKLNFLADSTYTNTTYSSSDESVAIIGNDGVITPLKVGDTTLKAISDDGFSTYRVEATIALHIDKKNLISDMGNFFYYVRKGVGHFGAFFVFGIFSSIFYMLYFDKKHYYAAIVLNFFIGFNVASITEFIQLYVPRRTGQFTDVLIDFSGFSLSSAIVIVIFIVSAIAIHFLKKKNSKPFKV